MREETRCRHYMGYSFRLAARVILYASSHRQDNTYHGLCYTSRGALAGTRNSSMGPTHEGSIRRSIAPWADALTTELHLAQETLECQWICFMWLMYPCDLSWASVCVVDTILLSLKNKHHIFRAELDRQGRFLLSKKLAAELLIFCDLVF